MKHFLITLVFLLNIAYVYGQKIVANNCPKDSVLTDSVYLLNKKFENNLSKRIHKYNPERKIVILWFNLHCKRKDTVLNVTLFNSSDASYSLLVRNSNIYGYFVIDSVLFVIDSVNLPDNLFGNSKIERVLYTEKDKCNFLTVGQLTGIECNYKIKVKNDKLKIRKQSKFLDKVKSTISYNFIRIFN